MQTRRPGKTGDGDHSTGQNLSADFTRVCPGHQCTGSRGWEEGGGRGGRVGVLSAAQAASSLCWDLFEMVRAPVGGQPHPEPRLQAASGLLLWV